MTGNSVTSFLSLLRNPWDVENIPSTWLVEDLSGIPVDDPELHRQVFEISQGNLEFLDGTNPWVEDDYQPATFAPIGYEWVLLHRWGDRKCSNKRCDLAHCRGRR